MNWESKSVLIAEDEETNFLLLVEYLAPTGIKIIRAVNGRDVLQQLDQFLPDIILLDIKMPIMDGYEVIRIIREGIKNIPVIAQTAYVMLGDMEKILESGCTDYISKPIDEADLIFVMSKYLKN